MSDADDEDSPAFNEESLSGTYGSLSIDADGSWTYTPDSSINSLNAGESASESFTVTAETADGEIVTQQVTVNLTGTNDIPVLTSGSVSATEDQLESGISATAGESNLLSQVSDADDGDTTFTIGQINGSAANVGQAITVTLSYQDKSGSSQTQDVSLTVNADGSYSVSGFDLDALPAGNNATAIFTYTAMDDSGAESSTETATITISGTNDSPIAVDDGLASHAQGEFTVASFASGQEQSVPDVAALSNGGYVVAWTEESGSSYSGAETQDLNDDGDVSDSGETIWATRTNHDVFLQRYDVNGNEDGDAIRINELISSTSQDGGRSQHDVNVVGLENGNFLVTWQSDDHYISQDNWDNGSRYIRGKIFDEDGNTVKEEFTIARAEYDPIVALPDGGFIVSWSASAQLDNTDQGDVDNPLYSDTHDGSGFGVVVQRFDAAGNELGSDLVVNTFTQGDQIDTDITFLGDGTALMTWQSENQDGSGYGVYAQRLELTSDGLSKAGSEIAVNQTTSSDQTDPEVTALSNGNAVITWESAATGQGVVAQLVQSDGSLSGSEIEIASSGSNPVVTALGDGFVVLWQDDGEIYTRTYDAVGAPSSVASVVNTVTAGEQSEPAVVVMGDGGYVVTYESGDGITGVRFDSSGNPFVQSSSGFSTDEDSVLTIQGSTLLSNDSDVDSSSITIQSVDSTATDENGVVIGTVELNGSGNVVFTPNSELDALRAGETSDVTLNYTITDGSATDSATITVRVIGTNDGPVLSDLSGTLSYTEGDGAIVIDNTITLTDVDDTNIEGATVQISGNYQSSEDLLSFTDQNGISGSWNSSTGALTLSGTATKAQYESALESVKYSNSSESPDTADRTVNWTVTDGHTTSSAGTSTISVSDSNDIATTSDISASGLEDASSISVTLSGSDSDGTVASFNISSLPANGTLYSDSGLSQSVSSGATITASNESATLYFVPDQDWSGQTTFQYAATDNLGGTDTTPATATITVSAVNDVATLSDLDGTLTYTEGDLATAIDHSITLADVDDTHIEGAAIQISGNYQAAEDLLSFSSQNGISGSWNSGTGTLTLSGTATKAQYEVALESVKYSNSSDDPDLSNRTVSWTVNDGDNNSATGTSTITVSAVNDAAELSGLGGTLAYTENDGATVIDSSITLTDVDDTHIDGATIQISGNYQSSEDLLIFSDQNGISGSWNSSTGTLTLSGTATKAQYESALESVKYSNSSENPDTDNRTISWLVTDGDLNSSTGTSTVSVAAVNDIATTSDVATSGNEDATSIAVTLSGSDVDGSIASFTVSSLPSNGTLYSDSALTQVVSSGAIIGASSGAATLYFDPDSNWSGGTSFQYAATDDSGATDASPATATITVSAVADVPTLDVVVGSGSSSSTADYAIVLNESGNNDALQVSNGGAILGGESELTLSIDFSMDANDFTDYVPLVSYATSSDDNEFRIELDPDSNDEFQIKLTSHGDSESSAQLDRSLLFDGEMHNLQVSIGQNGAIEYIIDGVTVSTDTFDNSSTPTISSGGTLLFGHEQDSVGGGFDSEEYFDGKIGDIKIYDTGTVTGGTTPVAHWDMNALNNGVISDQIGSNDLNVISISGSDFTTGSTPYLDAVGSVEGSGTDTVYPLTITTALVDIDGSESLTIVVSGLPTGVALSAGTDNGNGSYTVTSSDLSGLTMTVPDTVSADFDLTVTATATESSNSDTAVASETVTVDITNIVATTDDVSSTGNEDATYVAITLSGSDSDGSVASFTVSSLPSNGTLYSDSALTQAVTSGAVIAAAGSAATLYFDPDSNWSGATSFQYAATDDSGATDATPATASITITAVADAPVVSMTIGGETVNTPSGNSPNTPTTASGPDLSGATDYGDGQSGWDRVQTSNNDDVVIAGNDWDEIKLKNGDDQLSAGDADSNWSEINAGEGDDVLSVGDDWSKIDLKDGDDQLTVGDGDSGWAEIKAGDGDDVVTAGDDWDYINMGSGANQLTAGDGDTGWAEVKGGDDVDVISLGNDWDYIDLKEGSDHLLVGDGDAGWAEIKAGGGDDRLQVGSGWDEINGEGGTDTLIMEGSSSDYSVGSDGDWTTYTKDGHTTSVKNVEVIQFEDDLVTTYEYPVTVTATLSDTDGSESLSDMVISGLPSGTVSLKDGNGDALTANGDGSYTVSVNSGEAATFTLVSNHSLSSSEKSSISSTVTATEASNGDTEDSVQSATIVDGIIEGLEYTTSSGVSGLTDENGSFLYRSGDVVTFSIGDVVVGTVDTAQMGDDLVFLQDLAGVLRTNMNDEYVENMAVFLQSLDENGDAYDGIRITEEMRAAFTDGDTSNDIHLADATEEITEQLIGQVGEEVISEEAAMVHVQDMLEEYAGLDESAFEQRVSEESDILGALSDEEILAGDGYSDEAELVIDQNETLFADGDSSEILLGDFGDEPLFEGEESSASLEEESFADLFEDESEEDILYGEFADDEALFASESESFEGGLLDETDQSLDIGDLLPDEVADDEITQYLNEVVEADDATETEVVVAEEGEEDAPVTDYSDYSPLSDSLSDLGSINPIDVDVIK